MLENDHSNLQTKFGVHITSNIFKIIQFKNHGIEPPPHLPTLKAYPTPGVGGRFGIFSLKWRERMNLKVPGAILPLGCAILSTRAKTVRGVVATPLRRTRVNMFKIPRYFTEHPTQYKPMSYGTKIPNEFQYYDVFFT